MGAWMGVKGRVCMCVCGRTGVCEKEGVYV